MIRRPPRSTQSRSSAASDVYKRQFDGLIGLAAHVQMAAALPQNYIAFEYPVGQPEWWYEIIDGLPNPIVKRGFIDVWDRPGLGVTFNVQAAKSHLSGEDRQFFD